MSMSLKQKIQNMIDIIKFWKLLSYDQSTRSFDFDSSKITNNSIILVPPNIDSLDLLFYQKISGKTVTIRTLKVYTSLRSTFYFCSGVTLNLEFDTKYITNFSGAFSGGGRSMGVEAINTPLNVYGTKNQGQGLNAFSSNQTLTEIRFVEESIPYDVWDLDFSSCTNLSEESLLSIANGCETPPDDIPDNECGYITFASTTLENMPQYIKDIFAGKRCELG